MPPTGIDGRETGGHKRAHYGLGGDRSRAAREIVKGAYEANADIGIGVL